MYLINAHKKDKVTLSGVQSSEGMKKELHLLEGTNNADKK